LADPAPAPTPLPGRRLLFISNGYGEDSIGAEIIKRLPDNFIIEAYPTLGSGSAYQGICPIVGPRAMLASEGSRVQRGTIRRDIQRGGLRTLRPGLAFLRKVANHYDRVVVIGDLIGVIGCWLSGIRKIVYLDVYKTGVRRYSSIERLIIKQTAAIVFSRSEVLASQLKADGIDARFAGNVIMDTVSFGEYDVASRRHSPAAITLLPGSRAQVIDNFLAQLAGIRLLTDERLPDIFLAVAHGIETDDLAEAGAFAFIGPMTSEAGDLGTLRDERLTIHLSRGAVGNLIEGTDVVLSQAGTATIQAIGMGRPVITFNAVSDRPKRVRDEQRLFGDAWIRVPGNPGPISRAITRLLRDQTLRARLGAVGRDRIGGPGAMAAVIEELRR
jgi:uncharacterized protein (TIGR03492 family)